MNEYLTLTYFLALTQWSIYAINMLQTIIFYGCDFGESFVHIYVVHINVFLFGWCGV